jgi:hypothetical protein
LILRLPTIRPPALQHPIDLDEPGQLGAQPTGETRPKKRTLGEAT